MKSLPMIEARKQLTKLPERMEREQDGAVTVTRHGKPVLAILDWELYEAISETLEVMADQSLIRALRAGIKELKAGKSVIWEEARTRLVT